jgi:hypothetical protein
MGDGGKGSSPRPYSVDKETFSNNWDAIFGKKEKKVDMEVENVYNDERLVSIFDKQELANNCIKE